MWGIRGVYVHMSADAHEDWRYKCCEPLDLDAGNQAQILYESS